MNQAHQRIDNAIVDLFENFSSEAYDRLGNELEAEYDVNIPATAGRSRPANHSAEAIQVMEDWYTPNIPEPYPKYHEKLVLARDSGLTVAQVSTWFANMRARRGHTRTKKCTEDSIAATQTERLVDTE